MAKCTAHLICEVHRKLTLSVALSFGFDRSFLWSAEVQNNLVSIQPHMIDRLRVRYFELCSSSLQETPAGEEGGHHSQPRPPSSAANVVEAYFARWDDFTQRYCMKRNKGREECVLQAFRHGRRPHDPEFDRLFAHFAWLVHESRQLFPPSATSTSASSSPLIAGLSDDDDDDDDDAAGGVIDEEEGGDDGRTLGLFRSLGISSHSWALDDCETGASFSSTSSAPREGPRDRRHDRSAVSPLHADLARSLGLFFGADSEVAQGFLEADFVFSSSDGRMLRWRPYLLAHLMRDITDSVLGLFGLRQSKSDDYPSSQLAQIHDSVLRRANINSSPKRWAELYKMSVAATHLDLNEENLSPQAGMDAAWGELTTILAAVFVDVDRLVRAVVAFLSSPPVIPVDPTNDHHRQQHRQQLLLPAIGFPNHNQIHVLGNLLDLPAMHHEPYCRALSSLLVHDQYWNVIGPRCRVDEGSSTMSTTDGGGPRLQQQAAFVRYLAHMVRLNAHRLVQMELLKPPIRSWITDGKASFADELRPDLRYFGGLWGSLVIHDVIAGIHGFVTRTIRGCDTRALKQRIVVEVASVLGGSLQRHHLESIVRGRRPTASEKAKRNKRENENESEPNGGADDEDEGEAVKVEEDVAALEKHLLASQVIDQFGVVKAKCMPHACLMYVRKFTPDSELLLEEAVTQALSQSTLVLERIMGLVEDDLQSSAIDRLTAAVLRAIDERVERVEHVDDETRGRWERQLGDVVKSAVAKMCIGTAAASSTIAHASVQPLPPHTARRQTRKYVKMKRKIEQEVEGPVRAMLEAFFDDAVRLVADFRRRLDDDEQDDRAGWSQEARAEVGLALEEVVAALPARYASQFVHN